MNPSLQITYNYQTDRYQLLTLCVWLNAALSNLSPMFYILTQLSSLFLSIPTRPFQWFPYKTSVNKLPITNWNLYYVAFEDNRCQHCELNRAQVHSCFTHNRSDANAAPSDCRRKPFVSSISHTRHFRFNDAQVSVGASSFIFFDVKPCKVCDKAHSITTHMRLIQTVTVICKDVSQEPCVAGRVTVCLIFAVVNFYIFSLYFITYYLLKPVSQRFQKWIKSTVVLMLSLSWTPQTIPSRCQPVYVLQLFRGFCH